MYQWEQTLTNVKTFWGLARMDEDSLLRSGHSSDQYYGLFPFQVQGLTVAQIQM